MLMAGLSAAAAAQARIEASDASTSASVVAQDDTLIRIASRPCQRVPPHQQMPSACTAAMTCAVRASSPKATSTWLSATSLSTSWPASARPRAMREACRQQRSTRSARPSRPRNASAAQTSTPRARREPSGE